MYLGTTSSPAICAAMTAGRLGCLMTPGGGTPPPAGAFYACDNGRFGKGWPGTEKWWTWLSAAVSRHGKKRCLFAVAPDVMCDPAATLAESMAWLPRIRGLGVPAAFVAQDGSEAEGLVPWGEFDVLFLGGSTEWKLGPGAAAVAAGARGRGVALHMGRVSSRRRMLYAAAIGCATADGTYLAFGPDKNLVRLLGWLRATNDQIALWEGP